MEEGSTTKTESTQRWGLVNVCATSSKARCEEMDWMGEWNVMDASFGALEILSAMITPAVLISASGTLVLSTSNRLTRVADRVWILADKVPVEKKENVESRESFWINSPACRTGPYYYDPLLRVCM